MSATILIVEDDAGLREAIVDTLSLSDYLVVEADSGEAALLLLKKQSVDLVLTDVQMGGMNGLMLLRSLRAHYPDVPVILMTAFGTIHDAVDAMKEGACDYLAKPFSPNSLITVLSRYLKTPDMAVQGPVVGDASSHALLGLAKRVAATDATVMISGPSGSGKEVIARYIHDASPRNTAPFVAINCAAIPENMLEATLFGYEKGAFTGAVNATPGKFEQAQDGTLLLDEITEMDLALQSKLLRVLQEREVERLGGKKSISLNVRVLATSNRDLQQAVAEGTFREDLFYRLNVFPIQWLPLSQRPGDILPLAQHLVSKHWAHHPLNQQLSVPTFSQEAQRQLLAYHWPGNVRELENVVQRALILLVPETGSAQSSSLLPEHLMLDTMINPPKVGEGSLSVEASQVQSHPVTSSLIEPTDHEPVEHHRQTVTEQVSMDDGAEQIASSLSDNAELSTHSLQGLGSELMQQEHKIILETLHACEGSRKAVAERLGISPRTLRYKLAKMREVGIQIPA